MNHTNIEQLKREEKFQLITSESREKLLNIARHNIFAKGFMDGGKEYPRLDVTIKDNTGKENVITLFILDILKDDFKALVEFNKSGVHTVKRKSKSNPNGVYLEFSDIVKAPEYVERKKRLQDHEKASEEFEKKKIYDLLEVCYQEDFIESDA